MGSSGCQVDDGGGWGGRDSRWCAASGIRGSLRVPENSQVERWAALLGEDSCQPARERNDPISTDLSRKVCPLSCRLERCIPGGTCVFQSPWRGVGGVGVQDEPGTQSDRHLEGTTGQQAQGQLWGPQGDAERAGHVVLSGLWGISAHYLGPNGLLAQ